jgi:hypothetical protein
MKSNTLKLTGMAVLLSGAVPLLQADYASTINTYNPVAYWRLGETVSIPAGDIAANSGSLGASAAAYHSGTVTHPAAGALAGSTDGATYYDAAAGTFTLAPYLPALNPAGPFTVEAWLSPAVQFEAGSTTLTCALSCGQFADPRSGWLLYQSATGWNFRMYNRNGLNTSLSITGGGAPVAGAWYHIAAVYDGTAVKLYVNGTMAAEGTPTGTPPYVPGASGGFAIGARADSSFYWNGSADEVALYPSALPAATVTAHYNNGVSATPATPYQNLVLASTPLAYYRLGEAAYTPPATLPVAVNTGSFGASADGVYNPGMTAGAPGPRPPAFSGFGAANVGAAFNGTAGYVGTAYQANDLTDFTIVGWVRRGAIHSGRGGYFGQNDLLEFGDADAGANIELYVNARATNIKAPYPFADNEWGQFVITGTPTNTVLYANGRVLGSLTGNVDSYGSSAFFFNIGGGGVFNTTGDYFNGSIDEVAVLPVALTAAQVESLYFSAEVAPTITTQPTLPARPVYAGYTLSLSTAARGTSPISYQWRRGGATVTGQTSATLQIPSMTEALSGLYDVVVTNPYGAVTSAPVTVTVLPADGIAPTVQYAAGLAGFTKARVWFSKPLDPVTAQTAANYQIPGLTVTAATLAGAPGTAGDNIVDLTTSAQTPGQTYTVAITGVKDQMLPAATVAAGSSVTFKSWALVPGTLRFEHYDNIASASDAALVAGMSDPRVLAGTPTTLGTITGSFNTRSVFPDDSHENYLAKITGFITPPESGDYDFFVRSDDASRVYLSTTETLPDPATSDPIAIETGCCRAFQEPGDPATTATPISLQAGRKYAILVFLKEGGGGDWLELALRKTTDSTAAADLRPMTAQYFASYVDPNADVAFTLQPTNEEAVAPGASTTFTNISFATSDGGFTVTNSTETPAGPFVYDASVGAWNANGGNGPFNSRLISPPFVVPVSQSVILSFSHRYSFEGDYWDGGQVLVSVNGGAFSVVSNANFTANGYAMGRTIQGSGVLNGQYAFNGNSAGYSAGEFITSSAILGTFQAGDTVAVQFLGGWDDATFNDPPNWEIRSMSLAYSTPPSEVVFESLATATRQGVATPFSYQWQRNDGAGFTNILNATSPNYRFFATAAADFTATFQVVVGVPGNYLTSDVVRLVAPGSGGPTVSTTVPGIPGSATFTNVQVNTTTKTITATVPSGTGAASSFFSITPRVTITGFSFNPTTSVLTLTYQ